MLFLPFPTIVSGGALFLIGLGNAPVFPNMFHLTPDNFGEEKSQTAKYIIFSILFIYYVHNYDKCYYFSKATADEIKVKSKKDILTSYLFIE